VPSKTPEQHKLMEIAAHNKGGYGGVPQSVGKDFIAADKAKESTIKKSKQEKLYGKSDTGNK